MNFAYCAKTLNAMYSMTNCSYIFRVLDKDTILSSCYSMFSCEMKFFVFVMMRRLLFIISWLLLVVDGVLVVLNIEVNIHFDWQSRGCCCTCINYCHSLGICLLLGACMTDNGQTTSFGIANTQLRINATGTPYLLYENGANCLSSSGNSATTWTTRIEFICVNNTIAAPNPSYGNANGVDGKSDRRINTLPVIVEDSNCQLLIHYQTSLACIEPIACKAKVYVEHSEDGSGIEFVDLSPLINNHDNYVAEIDQTLLNTDSKIHKSTKVCLYLTLEILQLDLIIINCCFL